MKIPPALYQDDICELISRIRDDYPNLSKKMADTITRHAKTIMRENEREGVKDANED